MYLITPAGIPQTIQIEGKSFSQKIYKQKQFGKEVHLQYSIEYADTSNKKIIIPNEITQSSQPLVSDNDSFLDFDLISLLYFMIGEK